MDDSQLSQALSDNQDKDDPDERLPLDTPSSMNEEPTGLIKAFGKRLIRLLQQLFKLSLEQRVDQLIEDHNKTSDNRIGIEEKEMLHNVLEFGSIKVSEVMTPRSDIIAISDTSNLSLLKQTLIDDEHTRVPIFHDNLDHVKGFIHIKDLVPLIADQEAVEQFDLNALIRDILFVPGSMKVSDLLAKMKESNVHIAIIVDEYGGTDGLITLEDIMEEIVGDIADEYDVDEQDYVCFRKISAVLYDVSARIPLEELEKHINHPNLVAQEQDECTTLGGLLFMLVGKVPEVGEVIHHSSGLVFKVTQASSRAVQRVLIDCSQMK